MNRITKTVLATSVLISLVGCNQGQQADVKPLTSRPIHVVELSAQSAALNKSFSGVIQASESAALAFRVPGTAQSVLVNKGDQVKKGQVIARLDPHDYQVSLEELQARMIEAKSAHKLAKAELARVKQATQDDAIAGVNLDRAISGYERSLSAVKVVEKNIQRAEDALNYTELRAPFDGIIGSVDIEAYEQTLPGMSVATIQQQDQLEVEIQVPENMIQQFTLGQAAQISWYKSQHDHLASVSEISPTKHLIKQTYAVTLNIDSPSAELFDGKAVTVTTQTQANASSFCLPYSSVIGEKETLHINLVRDNTIITTPVVLDSLDANNACVTGEFSHNDFVVIGGSHYLKDGDTATNLTIKTL